MREFLQNKYNYLGSDVANCLIHQHKTNQKNRKLQNLKFFHKSCTPDNSSTHGLVHGIVWCFTEKTKKSKVTI